MPYRTDPVKDVDKKLELVTGESNKHLRASLAWLALQDRRADVLNSCLSKGSMPYHGWFQRPADSVDAEKDAEIFQMLEKPHFREFYPRRNPADHEDRQDDESSDEDSGINYDDDEKDEKFRLKVAGDFDIGGRFHVAW